MSRFLSRVPVRLFVLALLLLPLAPGIALSQDQGGGRPSPEKRQPQGPGVLSLLPDDSVTEHTLQAGGRVIAYTATAGTFPLFDQNGERSAAIFYTAYVAKDVRPPSEGERPLTFVFNGGPGAASVYLHLGLAGPRIVSFGSPPDGSAVRIVDNPDSWLAFTDLVFVDPVGTGWSRAAKPDGAKAFWSVGSDAQSLAKVMALYVARNGRQAAPLYILGESYGGFRAAKVARTVQREQGLVVGGIVMLSPFLEGALQGGRQNALGAALHLPSLAAAALDRRNAFTPEALAAAERFAMTDYLVALAGPAPQGGAGQKFYGRVAELTGLPADAIARRRGFIGYEFVKQAREGTIVSPYDASSVFDDPYPESESSDGSDPVLDGFLQALGGTFVAYARDTLGYKTPMTFNLLNREVSGAWNWDGGRSRASVSRDMRELLALTPSLRIFIAHGRSDLVTPYGVTRYVLDHLPQIGAPGRTALKLYRGGHMFYLAEAERKDFSADVSAFYAARARARE